MLTASAAQVFEGENAVFTVTASKPVEEDTEVVFTLKPGDGTAPDQGTNNTNLNDFGPGAFNPVTVTILAGETTATFTVTPLQDGATELAEKFSVEAVVGGQTLSINASVLDGQQGGGKVFVLTKGIDVFTPTAQGTSQTTSGNDTFIAVWDGAPLPTNDTTVGALDIIDGGQGTDTLVINTLAAVAAGNLNTMTVQNVEIVNVRAGDAFTENLSNWSDVETINVTEVGGALSLTAAAGTDINTGFKANATDNVTVNGGKDVNIDLTDVTGTSDIEVGGATTAAKGDVVVEATGKAAVNGSSFTMGAITVIGGKTIDVTQKAGDASGLVAGGTPTTHTQGAVTATANTDTVSVSIKQDAAVGAQSQAGVAKVDEVATVTFSKLDEGDSVTVSGLTFTAIKDLTAAQVAKAFANLDAKAVIPAGADGDTNGGLARADGVFTGSLAEDWNSGAVNGTSVVFTGNGAQAPDLLVTGTGTGTDSTVVTNTQGVNAVTEQNKLGVEAGVVTVEGAANLETVTVDGFAASTGAAGITGATNAKLATINLANGTNFDVESAAATLALTLSNVSGTVDVQAGTSTLNANVSHANATQTSTLQSASATTVNVSGAGNVAGTTATGLTAATVIDTSAMTGGKATFTIANGTATSYTGGAGVDTVTVNNAGTAITKAINLGAGDDKLILNGAVVVPTATLNGGTGTNTISMNGASAETLSANGNFAAKIENFQKLEITDTVAAATTVNMANMDGIKYVVSNNSDNVGGGLGNPQEYVFDITGLSLDAGGELLFGGEVVHVAAGTEIDVAIATAIDDDTVEIAGVTYDITVAGTVITLTSTANVAPQPAILVTTTGETPDGLGNQQAYDFDIAGLVLNETGELRFGGVTVFTAPGDATNATTIATAIDGDTVEIAGVTYDISRTATAITLTSTTNVAPQPAIVVSAHVAVQTGITDATVTPVPGVADGLLTITDATVTPVLGVADGLLTITDATVTPVLGSADIAAGPALTIDNMADDGTLELVAEGDGVIVIMDDATGINDKFNLVTKVVDANLDFGTVDVAGVETLTLNAVDTNVTALATSIDRATLDLKADKATSLTIDGNSHVTLTLDAATDVLATVNASALTGGLTLEANGAVAMTITGGSGKDVLYASTGATAKADVIDGGAGDDIIFAGSNGAKLTGGAGNDLFVLNSGNLESNTYSSILDFSAGDLLQLRDSATENAIASFTKLDATLNENTSTFQNFVDAAIEQAAINEAVWFNFGNNAYVVIDQDNVGTSFVNGTDSVIELIGIDGANLSFNSDFGTVALI